VKSLPVVLLAVPVLSIYALCLQCSPVYLAHDEVLFALQAHSIASSGHDLSQRFLPLYFQMADAGYWATPITIYVTALFVTFRPLSEVVVRLPSVLVGLVDVFLVYVVAKRIFSHAGDKGSRYLALIASGLLALTPAHFIHSRLAFDELYPVPFVLAWLLCLVEFARRRQLRLLFSATSLLGIGVYSYVAAVVMMPVYFFVTLAALFQMHMRSARPYWVALTGFAIPLLPLAAWLLAHPSQYGDEIRMFNLYDAEHLSPVQGLRRMLSYRSIAEHLSVYYNYFNPAFLFFSGDTSLHSSTREAGVLSLPLAVFLPLGVYEIVTRRRTGINLVVLLGLITAPIAAALVGESYRINRALVMVPFAVLIATFGVERFIVAGHKGWRIAGLCLLLLVPVQFAHFYLDYLTDYRLRSSVWFERNIRGALEEIIAREQWGQPPAIYLNHKIGWIGSYWRFYLIKHHREDLLPRTVYFDPGSPGWLGAPAGSLILSTADEADRIAREGRTFSDGPNRMKVITEPDERPSFVVFER